MTTQSPKTTGGSAFPSILEWDGACWRVSNQDSGMSLRDYFAAKALQGMLASLHPLQSSDEQMLARDAYTVADAMISMRSQT